MRRVTAYGIVALLALATLDEGGSAPTGLLAWHAMLVLLLGLELVVGSTDAPYRLAAPTRAALASYAMVVLMGALLAPYGFAAWLYTLEVIAALGLAWLAARVGPALLPRLAPPLLAVVSAQSLLFLYSRFVRGEPRPAGTFLNPNHLASWIVTVLLLAWGARLVTGRVSRRADLLYALTTALAAVVIALTGSRGALVGLVAGTAVIVVLAWKELGTAARRIALAGCALFLVAGVVGVAYRQSQSDPFRYQRLRIWRATTEIVAAHPALGAGPGQLRHVARGYQFPDGHGPLQYDRGFETTHSDLLRVPAELGIPGLIAMLAILATVGLAITRRHAGGTLTAAGVGATGALAALAAHALVENLSSRSALIALATVLAGALVSGSAPSTRRMGTVVRFALLAVLVLSFAAGDVAPYLAWREMQRVPRGHLSDADAQRLVRAMAWNPIHPDAWRRRAEHIVGGGASFDLDGYTLAREAAEHAARLDPQSPELQAAVARVEAAACGTLFAGDPRTRDRMSRAYSTVERLDPYQALWPLEEAEAALDCGAAEVAEAAARRALALEPEAASPRLVLAAALLRSSGAGAVVEAERLLTEALERASQWSSAMPPGAYARRLLTLDAQNVARVEREIREARDAHGSR